MSKKAVSHFFNDTKSTERSARELPLATQLAVVALSRALRAYLHRSKRFVVTVAVPAGTDAHAYGAAAHWLLDHPRQRAIKGSLDADVILIKEKDYIGDVSKLARLNEIKRAIVLVEKAEWITDHVRLASDFTTVLPRPTARDIKIAARRMGFGNLKDKDAEFLESQDLARLSLVMRRGRSVDAMVSRLQKWPAIPEETETANPEVGPTLRDLYGFGEAKTWGMELATDLTDWKDGKLAWTEVDRGLLLSGPPGCGKTSYAAALARTCDVKLVVASAARWQAKGHLGDLLKAMRSAFQEAMENAPSILFIDEFDSFPARDDMTGENAGYSRQVVNGLLECLDGAQGREGVVVIGATNHPHLVDEALLRPGRLERHFAIPLPDKKARAGILRYHLGKDLRSCSVFPVVNRTANWTGADIERCVRDARRIARRSRRPLEVQDLFAAMPARTAVPDDFLRSVAIHELGHGIISVLVDADELLHVSVEDTFDSTVATSSLGGAVFKEFSIRRKTSTYFQNKIAVLLGGMAAERVVFGDYSTGAAGHREADLNIATDLATMMEITWGFGSRLSSEVWKTSDRLAEMRLRKPDLSEAVEATLRREMTRAEALLECRRDVLLSLTDALIARKHLKAEEVINAVQVDDRPSPTFGSSRE
ncbi:AAA family ATPase [Agrobacterium rosae]|uniref:AAA family ATPase n=1 Tax=Agrobacterium rosae TaxID=1972867 RepID=UPI003A80FFD5